MTSNWCRLESAPGVGPPLTTTTGLRSTKAPAIALIILSAPTPSATEAAPSPLVRASAAEPASRSLAVTTVRMPCLIATSNSGEQ